MNHCEQHGYEGVPKCPYPNCVNSSGRDVFRTIKLAHDDGGNLLDADGNVRIESERIFVRDRGANRSWVWREVAYLEPVT